MAAAVLPVIAGQQWRLLVRDRRLAVLAVALLLVLCAGALTGAAMHAAQEAERVSAQAQEAQVWEMQGPANPHGAAHFGRYVFKQTSPLSVLDPGLLPQLGTSLHLEAHMQNPAMGRAIDGGAALDRFAGLSPASMLQILAPLLIILSGFATFSGERARTILRQELAAGTAPTMLVVGRLLGLAGTIPVLLGAVAIIGVAALLVAGGGAGEIAALLWMLLGYALYLFTFAALTLAASAAFASARAALVVLLGFWAMATLFVPRIAPAVAEAAVPTLSAPAFEAAVTKEVREGPSGHDPQDARLERLRNETMRRYGVKKIEDLPVDFNGIALLHGEALSSAIYARRFNELYDGYDRQAGVQLLFGLLSPAQAIRPWSAALAQSDQHAHRRFLEQADAYRLATVQRLNRDIIQNRKPSDAPYLADVAKITREERFTAQPPGHGETLGRHWLDFLNLVGWAALSLMLALAASRRLARGQQ